MRRCRSATGGRCGPDCTRRGERLSGLKVAEDDLLLVAAESGGRLVRVGIQEEHGRSRPPPDGQPAAVGAVGQGRCLRLENRRSPDAMSQTCRRKCILAMEVADRRGQPASVRTDGQRAECPARELDFLADAGRRHVPDPQPVIRQARRSPATFRRGRRPGPARSPGCGKVAHGSPVAASHRRTVLSQLPEAIQRPSGLKATG